MCLRFLSPLCVCVCVCVCTHVRTRACVRACMRACVCVSAMFVNAIQQC